MNKNLPTMVIHSCELGIDQFPFLLGYLNLFFYWPVSANRCQVGCHVGRHLSQTRCISIILFPPGSSSFALWGRVTLAVSLFSLLASVVAAGLPISSPASVCFSQSLAQGSPGP